MRVGIFGGTFNPIHYGHLINAQFIVEDFSLDRAIFIPSKSPVHKKLTGNITHENRFQMVKLAINGNSAFDVSRIEIDRVSPSYTITTIKHLIALHPGSELFLIIGSDSYHEFNTWKDYREILQIVTLIVMKRPDKGAENSGTDFPGARVQFADNPYIDISSSGIQRFILEGRSIQYMVPTDVERYILEKGLYRN